MSSLFSILPSAADVNPVDEQQASKPKKKKKKHIQVIHRIPEPVKKMLESGETLSDEMIIQAIQSDSKN